MSTRHTDPCDDRLEALDRYLEGGDMERDLEAHLESCRGCRRYVKRLDGLEAFLREAHDEFETMQPGSLREKRRPVPHKIAAWAVLLVMIAGAAAFTLSKFGADPAAVPPAPLVADLEQVVDEGRVILTMGAPTVLECEGDQPEPVRLGSRVTAGCTLDVPDSSGVAVQWSSGLTVLASAASRFTFTRSDGNGYVVRVEQGQLSLRNETPSENAALTVLAGSDTIESGGRALSVDVRAGRIHLVTAVEGGLDLRGADGAAIQLRGGQSFDGATRKTRASTSGDDGSSVVLGLLSGKEYRSTLTVLSVQPLRVRIDGQLIGATPLSVMLGEGDHDVTLSADDGTLLLTETVALSYGQEERIVYEDIYDVTDPNTAVASAQPASVAANGNGTKDPARPIDIVALIREALATGDTQEALALVEKHWATKKSDPDFLGAAGDTYRKLGRFEDAVSAYLAAAEKGSGTSAEKSYLAASRITLEKLRDVAQADAILTTYKKKFSSGFYQNEASFLSARILVKQKRYTEARAALESLLAASPKGYLATKAHLLLGSILVTYLSDCAAAKPHLSAVKKAAPGGKYATEADRFIEACGSP